MSDQERGPSLDDFVGEPTRDLDAWRRLWDADLEFPIRSHRGPLGRLVVAVKRLLRPLVKVPQNDLWERQRVFNLIVLENLERTREVEEALAEIDRLRWNAQEFKDLSIFLTRFVRSGVDDIVGHNDALFSRLDQKVDRYRRESQRLWGALAGALEAAPEPPPTSGEEAPGDAGADAGEVMTALLTALDSVGDPDAGDPSTAAADAGARLEAYLELLPDDGTVLDLHCGEGAFVAALASHGYRARGAEPDPARAARAAAGGLDVRRADFAAALRAEAPGELAAVTAFGLVERLTPAELVSLARLAWRVLAPGGALLLETPNPLSMVVAAQSFWRDPRRRRPVHPEALEALLRAAGFEPVRRVERLPFAAPERLPEISLAGLSGEARELADRLNRLRDRLDELLYGDRVYAVVGRKTG